MMEKIRNILKEHDAVYEIIYNKKPIYSVKDAVGIYNIEQMAPVFIIEADNEFLVLILSASRGKIDFNELKGVLGYEY